MLTLVDFSVVISLFFGHHSARLTQIEAVATDPLDLLILPRDLLSRRKPSKNNGKKPTKPARFNDCFHLNVFDFAIF